MSADARDEFRSRIGQTLGLEPDKVTLFAKGRVALFAILRSLDIGVGDEVILPAFTCVAVPNAIVYAGARPVFVDIDPATYTIEPAAAEAAVTSRTRVILAQNTFGLSANLDELAAVSKRNGLILVDDCTHGLGGRYRGRPNGATAAVSFFSTQWSKPISTGLGGFAVAQDENVAARLRMIEESAPEPSRVRVAALRLLDSGRSRAGRGPAFRAGRQAYRALSRLPFVPGSSSPDELEGTVMPHGFLAKLSRSQARLGSDRIRGLVADVTRRRAIAYRYSSWLAARGRAAASEPVDAYHTFLRYPLRVRERQTFRKVAELAGLDLGDWFISPIHPIRNHLERWGYHSGVAPNAEQACREIVNLPTDPGFDFRDVDRVLAFMAKCADLII